jgi:hypothetical protein
LILNKTDVKDQTDDIIYMTAFLELQEFSFRNMTVDNSSPIVPYSVLLPTEI